MRFLGIFFKVLLISLLVIYALIWLVPYAMPLRYDDLNEKPYTNSQFVRIDEVKLHFRYWESEADAALGNVMLIHGFGGSTYSWREVIVPLTAAGFNVVAVDLPAFGYSDKGKGVNHSKTARAELLWEFADRLGVQYRMSAGEKWHIVGHSMGGEVIAAMAGLSPNRAASLVFVDGAAADGVVQKQAFKYKLLKTVFPLRRIAEVGGGYYFYKPKRIKKLLRNAYQRKPTSVEVNAYLAALRQPRTSSAIVESALYSEEVTDFQIADIQQNALIIWGTEDTWVPIEEGRQLDTILVNSTMVEIKGAGHNPMETHAAEFNRLLIGFLDKNLVKTTPKRTIIGQ